MKYLKQTFLLVLMGSGVLYIVSSYIPQLGFSLKSEYSNEFVIYLFLGVVLWFVNGLIGRLLKLLTLPISSLTFGISSLIVNFLLLYVFEQFVNYLDVGVWVLLGNVVQVFVLSCVLSMSSFLIKKI